MPPSDTPPTHKIHLSTPPQTRYTALATLYAPNLRNITSIFDTLVLDIFPAHYLPWIKSLARIFLRGVYDADETAEIRGIADAAGVDLYLVVCFNVLLDLLMGCTSGAALSSSPSPSSCGESDGGRGEGGRRMLHFRTLDWDMPALRALLVQLEYVSPDENGVETVIATSITYVGFVGVLTAVRRGLSVSLNFRPNHDDGSWWKQIRYYSGHALVLLGFRRSISSVLRGVVIPPTTTTATDGGGGWLKWLSGSLTGRKDPPGHNLSLSETVERIIATPSTACYLILSDGVHAYVLEKDIKTTTVESSSSFIVATNNDRATKVPSSSSGDPSQTEEHTRTGTSLLIGDSVSVGDFIKDSIERRECMQAHWDRKVARAKQAASIRLQARRDPLRRTRSSRRGGIDVAPAVSSSVSVEGSSAVSGSESAVEVTATLDEIVAWTRKFPTTNEMTHFSTVMDPVKGIVVWIRRYSEPLEIELTDSE
ncbi:beta subunit of N-acylethanolamine-hydrolyzing acid amidase-domain-containing protein [Aspergillus californicus]